jgi:hypothetical protein
LHSATPEPPPGGGALDAQHDAQAAVRWFRANAATLGIDPDRDQRVPYECAVATRDAAVAAGNVAELVSRQGGHDVTAWVNPNLATMTPFFFEHVVSS